MTADTTFLQRLLNDAACRDEAKYEELLMGACDRLRALARRKLRGFPSLRRWVETDDVLQQAMLRLHRSLKEVRPSTVAGFFGLAGLQIRRELYDLHRHHFGPQGVATNHHTDGHGAAADDPNEPLQTVAEKGEMVVAWDRFHELVQALPVDERAVVDCLFIGELSQDEAAQVLGLSLRTVKRRWQSARILLQAAIEEGIP